MDLSIFLQGLLIGFSISVPVGPVGVIVIRRTLAEGFASGLMSGVGCATGMAIFGSVIGFGLTSISDLVLRVQRPLAIGGGLFLIYLGYTIIRAAPPAADTTPQRNSLLSAYASTFALTIFNPAVILYFLAIFASSDLVDQQRNYATALVLVLGVFLGTLAWWLGLSGAVSLLRARLNDRVLRWANRTRLVTPSRPN
jgi:threonine/homoserine/homoserine lactone efflux protein